ncbi:MAG: hypothetical protein NVS2B14_05740 [Chamaesiphon sp.]
MSSHLTHSTEFNHLPSSSQALSEGADFHSVLAIAISQVCEVTGWEYSEAWIPSQELTVLELSPAWCGNSAGEKASLLTLEQFRLCSEGFIFPPGTGLPGRIWSSQQPEWLCDAAAQSETFFLRNQIAKGFGIKAGYGVPVFHNQEVKAVIIFFTCKDCEEDRQLVELAQAAAVELGRAFEELMLSLG